MKILVCGGRGFDDTRFLEWALDLYVRARTVNAWDVELIHGAGRGADTLAHHWARGHHFGIKTFPADWDRYGKAAGPRRNQQMIDEGKPDVVIAFAGGGGTADMMRRAKKAGVPVIQPVRAWIGPDMRKVFDEMKLTPEEIFKAQAVMTVLDHGN